MPIAQPYLFRLTTMLPFPKHRGKTLQQVIDEDLAYIIFLHQKGLITWEVIAWDYFMEKARGETESHKVQTSIYKRHAKRR